MSAGTIWIVDDCPAQLEPLVTLLTEQGYGVRAFLDGNLALEFVESALPDLILLDDIMPGMDGCQVCRHLKARERTRDIPIIFLTAMAETLNKAQAFRLGAVDYIPRPFEAEEVLARVKTHLILHRQRKQLEAKNIQLQESEELHRLTLNSISDAVFLTDGSGAFKYICPNVNTIFGYSFQEVQALSNISKLLGRDLFVPTELETLGEIQNIERVVTDRAGKEHTLLINVKRVSIREGTQLYTCRDITERKRVEEALQESEARYRELWKQTQAALTKAEALYRVKRSLMATTDLFSLLQAVVESVAEALPANRVVLFTIDLTGLQVIREVKAGPGKNNVVEIPFDELWEGLSGWVLREGKPALSPNTGFDPRESSRTQRRRSETNCGCIIIVPLLYQDKSLGTMTAINRPDERDFSQEDVDLMMAFAIQAAIAIENARLYEELQSSYDEMEQRVDERTTELAQVNASLKAEIDERRRAEEALQATVLEKERLFDTIHRRAQDLESLQAISSGLRQAGTRETMQQFIVEKAVVSLGGDAGGLLQIEGGMMVLKAEYGRSTGLLGLPQTFVNCVHWQAARIGEPVYITGEAGQNGSTQPCAIYRALMDNMATGVVIPLKTADATVGILHLAFASWREFSNEKKHMIATIAEVTGSALHRAGILETLEQRVADRTRELAALYEVTAVASEALDLQTMLERSLERVLKAMRSSTAAIHLLNEDGETLGLAAYQTSAPDGQAKIDRILPVSDIKEGLIVRGEPLVIPVMASYPEIPNGKDVSKPCTYVGAPMRAGGRRFGILSVARDASQQFSIEEIALLASVADQIAVAMENARLRQNAEQMAIMEERTRLASELHDSVTQSLSSVMLLSQAASDFSETNEWGRVKHYMERIRDTSGQALKEMRLLLYELQPSSKAQEDLVEMLTHRLEAVEEHASVNFQLRTEAWLRLPASTEKALYRIAQEALNNALKHSGASLVTIILRSRPGVADLEVNDNGIGFDLDSVKHKGGIGLISMQQRAEKLGGSLTIKSIPGNGTSIKVSLGT